MRLTALLTLAALAAAPAPATPDVRQRATTSSGCWSTSASSCLG
jgi:hypothetical protein